MSFEIFLQRFLDGDGTPGDRAAAITIITPLLAGPVSEGFGRIETTDGDADIYASAITTMA